MFGFLRRKEKSSYYRPKRETWEEYELLSKKRALERLRRRIKALELAEEDQIAEKEVER